MRREIKGTRKNKEKLNYKSVARRWPGSSRGCFDEIQSGCIFVGVFLVYFNLIKVKKKKKKEINF